MQPRSIGLAHITLGELTLAQMAPVAAAAGFRTIAVRMWRLADVEGVIIGRDPAYLRQVMRIFADEGLAAYDVSAIMLEPHFDLDEYRPGLELAAEIGAKRVLALGRDPDAGRAADNFAVTAEATAAFGLGLDLEFMPTSEIKSLPQAARLVAHGGRDNVGIVVDTTHLVRSGGTVDDIARVDPRYFVWAQLADGPAEPPNLSWEAGSERLLPGAGAFPLADILRALPAHIPLAVEVPSRSRIEAGVTGADWARQVMSATARVLASAT